MELGKATLKASSDWRRIAVLLIWKERDEIFGSAGSQPLGRRALGHAGHLLSYYFSHHGRWHLFSSLLLMCPSSFGNTSTS